MLTFRLLLRRPDRGLHFLLDVKNHPSVRLTCLQLIAAVPRRRLAHGIMCILLLLPVAVSMAQTQLVEGRVVDEDQKPLLGASILVKGASASATSTDDKGLFRLAARIGDTLRIQLIGFEQAEIIVPSSRSVKVVLYTNDQAVDEVVVTAFGIKREIRKLGYSVQEVKGSEVDKVRDANPLNALAGKVAGLNVGASTEMLGRPEVVLRGSKDLLYVVDGVPINSDTWNISPDDIASYTVLKGPNAAALYGSRGINGAIVITTKKGTAGNQSWAIEFNSTNQVESSFIVLPEPQNEYGRGTAYDYSYGNNLYDTHQRLPTWGPRFEGQLIQQYDSPWDAATNTRVGTPWIARGAENYENFVQAGLLSTNNIALSRTGEHYDTRISYSHMYQRGIYPNTKLNADNFSINSGFDLTPKLRVEGHLNLNLQYTPNIPDVSYGPNSYAYIFRVYGTADYDIRDLRNIYGGAQGVQDQVQYAHEYGRVNNPWFMAEEWLRSHDKTDLYGTLSMSYKINEDLTLMGRTQVTTWSQLRTEKVPPSTNLNGYVGWYNFGWFGDYREDQRRVLENNTDINLQYNKTFGDFSLSGLGGLTTRVFQYHSDWTTSRGLVIPKLYNMSNSENPPITYTFKSDMMVYSGFYSLDMGYKQYVNLNTTGRVDNLSTLPSGRNTFFYPSVSLSTILNDYMTMPRAINMLKFRGSVAEVKGGLTLPTIPTAITAVTGIDLTRAGTGILGYGDDLESVYDGPSYANQSAYTVFSHYGGVPGVTYESTIANPTLLPFSRRSYEAGLDLRLWNGRIGLDATYFRTINGPQIYAMPVAPSTSFESRNINGITTLNQGFEFSLSAVPVQRTDFQWELRANWSNYRETLRDIYAGEEVLTMQGHNYRVGERLDAAYGRILPRDQSGNVIHDASGLIYPTPTGLSQNGFLGHLNPDFTFGIHNSFRYKSWSLAFQFDGRIGGVIYNYAYAQAMNAGAAIELVQGDMGEARYNEWASLRDQGAIAPGYVGSGVKIVSGTPQFENGKIINWQDLTFAPNDVPVNLQSYITGSIGLLGFDEYWMMDRSFAKLREFSIGYTLPAHRLAKGIFRTATFSVVGRNLLYFAARKDMDLDSYAAGFNASDRSMSGNSGRGVGLQSAVPRRFGFNINLSF